MRSRALGLAALAFLVGLCASLGGDVRSAFAQQLDAGKPPHQIFSATCSACHRSARGLLRSVPPGSLPGFMRQHYTTGSDMAGTMAAYVLANGGTDRVAEPPPKREPKQKAKSDSHHDVAARSSDAKEQQKARRHKDAKKGKAEPAETSKDVEKQEPKQEAAKPSAGEADKPAEPEKSATPPAEPPKVVECRIVAPAPPPREPVSQITLPGFPPPVVEPPPAPITDPPGCDPNAVPDAAKHSEAAPGASDEVTATATTPAEATEAPKLDIMRDEAHSAKPSRAQQKKRAE